MCSQATRHLHIWGNSRELSSRVHENMLLKFMKSNRTMTSPELAKNSLGVVLGPKMSGKSFLLRKSLKSYEREIIDSHRIVPQRLPR